MQAAIVKAKSEGRTKVKLERAQRTPHAELLALGDQIVAPINLSHASPLLRTLVKDWTEQRG